MTAPDERVSDERLREIVSDPAQVSGESLRAPVRTTIAIARELLAAREALEAADATIGAAGRVLLACGLHTLDSEIAAYRRARGAP